MLALLSCALCASTWRIFGHIWDEPEHIAAGLVLLDRGVSNGLRRLLVFALAASLAAFVWLWAKKTLPVMSSADTASFDSILNYAQQVLTTGPAWYLLYPFHLLARPFFAPDCC